MPTHDQERLHAWPQLSAPSVLTPPPPSANADRRKPAPPPKPEQTVSIKESFLPDPSKTYLLAGKRTQHVHLAGLTPHMMSYAAVYPCIVGWQTKPMGRDNFNCNCEEERLQDVYMFVHAEPQPWRDQYGLVSVPDPDGTFRQGFNVMTDWDRFQANRAGQDTQYDYIADNTMKRIIHVCKEHNKYKQVFQHVYKDYEPVMQVYKDHGAYLHFGWPVENGSNFYTILALKLQLQGNNQVRVLWASQVGAVINR